MISQRPTYQPIALHAPYERAGSGLWLLAQKVQCSGRARQDTPWRVRRLGPSKVELSCEVTFFPDPLEILRQWCPRNPLGGRQIGWPVGWELAVGRGGDANSPTHDTVSPTSASEAINAGANLCAFLPGVFNNGGSMSIAATYATVPMVSAGSPDHNTIQDFWAQILYLANPATGSNTLTITVTGTLNYVYFNLVGMTGVDQATSVRAATYTAPANPATNGSGDYSLVVTSQAGDMTLAVFHGTAADGIVSLNQTSDGIDNGGGFGMGSSHANGAATVTHSCNTTVTADIAACGLSIQAAGAAAAYIPPSFARSPSFQPFIAS